MNPHVYKKRARFALLVSTATVTAIRSLFSASYDFGLGLIDEEYLGCMLFHRDTQKVKAASPNH